MFSGASASLARLGQADGDDIGRPGEGESMKRRPVIGKRVGGGWAKKELKSDNLRVPEMTRGQRDVLIGLIQAIGKPSRAA